MCGICGGFSASAGHNEVASNVRAMTQSLFKRGPDGENIWQDTDLPLTIGHRRLSIIDLSSQANQPMLSADKRFVMAFNGEIYNYQEIGKDLEKIGTVFRSSSDSEVLLEAISRYGLEEALKKARGMFALAVYDRSQRRLHLARDRFGQKPLYFFHYGNRLYFASSAAAFRHCGDVKRTINRQAINSFLSFNYICGNRSIFNEISKVKNGSICTFSLAADEVVRSPDRCFYDICERWEKRTAFAGSFSDAVAALDFLLDEVIEEQKRSDVELGCFLSGGTDSSTLAAKLNKHLRQNLKTFTVGFSQADFDESASAKAFAQQIGCENHQFLFDDNELTAMIPEVAAAYEEPFADTSQLPTLFLSLKAREKVKVCLSGDGADEVFGGYIRHAAIPKILAWQAKLPFDLSRRAGQLLAKTPQKHLEKLTRLMTRIGLRLPRHPALKLQKLLQAFGAESHEMLQLTIMNEMKEPALLPQDPDFLPDFLPSLQASPFRRGLLLDLMNYLRDDILVKIDRAAMNFGLETRMPYLDHRVVEFAFSLPDAFLFSSGVQKRILCELQKRLLPVPGTADNRKTGFSPALHGVLRGRLKDWALSMLEADELNEFGLENRLIRQKWFEFSGHTHDWTFSIWAMIVLSQWLQKFKRNEL